MKKCLVCKKPIKPFINFGPMPIANGFLSKKEISKEYKFKLQTGFCNNCKMVQLIEQPKREKMFHKNYSFFSSTSNYMIDHFHKYCKELKKLQKLNKNSFVVEIGCNDGILLQNFKTSNIPCLGIEPSKNVAKNAISKKLDVIIDFFDEKIASKILKNYKKTDLILSANVICHIPYIHSIFKGVKKLLNDQGLFIFEDPYIGDVIKKTSFDQIYDEHVFLFSAHSVKYVANMHGLELVNLKRLPTHGGSMRYYIGKKNKHKISTNIKKTLMLEKKLGLNKTKTYLKFEDKINKIKHNLVSLLKDLKKNNKKVVAYGATSKSTTVTNYFGIDKSLVECIFDNTPIKQNKLSPGKHIPIKAYEHFRISKPDYVLLFAWNHAREIFEKEKKYMINKKWITYIPKVKIHK
tara:strand:+ start:516 stop:1733 length:1218 start_codon:yes stop_codon:yes gene_type:complete